MVVADFQPTVFRVWGTDAALVEDLCSEEEAMPGFIFSAHEGYTGVQLIRSEEAPAWAAYRKRGIFVNTWHAQELAAYAGISRAHYVRLLATLGAAQWAVLDRNPLLEPDDLLHAEQGCCVFSATAYFDELALLLERPRLCSGSRWFYSQLLANEEVEAMDRAVGVCATVADVAMPAML